MEPNLITEGQGRPGKKVICLTSSNQKDFFSKMTPQLGREWTLVLENKREIPLSDQAEEAGQEKGTVNPHPGLLFIARH